jgi:hypothetical protein
MTGRHGLENAERPTPINDEPTTVETDPLTGRDDHPAPSDQPWRRIAEEVKKSGDDT